MARFRGSLRSHLNQRRARAGRGALAELAGLIAEGAVSVPVAATYPLAEACEAFNALAQRRTRGKIVLLP